jgi:hypothetical protein
MTSQDKALRRGIGSLADVAGCLGNIPRADAEIMDCVRQSCDRLAQLLSSEEYAETARAIACAVLNSNFRETGDLWQLDDKGGLTKNYISTGSPRDAIADLAGL